jgi:8-oxo-dGTP pyrophosphatase MutT (NUDIX family)
MQKYFFQFSFDPIPPVMLRGRQGLIVVRSADGKYIMGRKRAYPEGIVRFVGGGIEEGEDSTVGAMRELHEELGVRVSPEQLKPLAEITSEITGKDKKVTFICYLYEWRATDEKLNPADDLDGLAFLSKEEMRTLVEKFQSLSTELILGFTGDPKFRWSDYGKYFSEVHRIGLELSEQS